MFPFSYLVFSSKQFQRVPWTQFRHQFLCWRFATQGLSQSVIQSISRIPFYIFRFPAQLCALGWLMIMIDLLFVLGDLPRQFFVLNQWGVPFSLVDVTWFVITSGAFRKGFVTNMDLAGLFSAEFCVGGMMCKCVHSMIVSIWFRKKTWHE